MNDPKRTVPDSTDKQENQSTYEAPRIVWREPYEPVAFGVSCAVVLALPACNPGPFVV